MTAPEPAIVIRPLKILADAMRDVVACAGVIVPAVAICFVGTVGWNVLLLTWAPPYFADTQSLSALWYSPTSASGHPAALLFTLPVDVIGAWLTAVCLQRLLFSDAAATWRVTSPVFIRLFGVQVAWRAVGLAIDALGALLQGEDDLAILLAALLFFFVTGLWLLVRLCLLATTIVETRRLAVAFAWQLTRGRFWSLLAVLAPTLVLQLALFVFELTVGFSGFATPIHLSDPAALDLLAIGVPTAALGAVSNALELAIVAWLYRILTRMG